MAATYETCAKLTAAALSLFSCHHCPRSHHRSVCANTLPALLDSQQQALGKLFVGGIALTTTEAAVREHFSQYGKLLDCVVLFDRTTGRPRGFAFVQFEDARLAAEVASGASPVLVRFCDASLLVHRLSLYVSAMHHS